MVDDEAPIRQVLHAYLEREGYAVIEAAGGREALQAARAAQPQVVILDLMLPDLPGEEVCRQLRQVSDAGIIMLTAKLGEEERIRGLALGADDYVVKPFSPREVVARVRALSRRLHPEAEGLVDQQSFNGGRLVLDLARHTVTRDGEPAPLTATEFRLLLALARHPGRIFSRAELLDRIRSQDFDGFERTVDSHVKNLRQKLEAEPRHPAYILTAFGAGYKFGGRPDD